MVSVSKDGNSVLVETTTSRQYWPLNVLSVRYGEGGLTIFHRRRVLFTAALPNLSIAGSQHVNTSDAVGALRTELTSG